MSCWVRVQGEETTKGGRTLLEGLDEYCSCMLKLCFGGFRLTFASPVFLEFLEEMLVIAQVSLAVREKTIGIAIAFLGI